MKYTMVSLTLAGILALGTTGCKEDFTRTINGKQFKFSEHKITQLSSDKDNQARYGVISDVHGEVGKAGIFARKFAEMEVDGIIVPGDLVNNERFSGRGKKWDDSEETFSVLEAIAKQSLPIFVIPGNHDQMTDYNKGLEKVTAKYPNVIDMNKFRVFNGDDVDFVSLPGYTNRQFTAPGALYATPDLVTETGKLNKGLDDSVVLIAHGAGKTNTNGKLGPATIYSGEDVGDSTTREMMKKNNIPFAVVGNIHEAGGYAADHNGKLVKQGEWAEQFTVNFGGLEKWKNLNGQTYNGMAGILTVKGNKAKYEMFFLK